MMHARILYADENTSFSSLAGALTSAMINDEFSPIICETIATRAFKNNPEFRQLDENIELISIIVKTSIKEDYDIILMCSKNEWKLKYMKWLAEYIMEKFGCPVYDYKKLKKGEQKLIKYDKDKVLKKCKKNISGTSEG